MTLLEVMLALVVIGVLLYLVNNVIPMAQPIKTIINVLTVLIVVVWLLAFFGIVDAPRHWKRL